VYAGVCSQLGTVLYRLTQGQSVNVKLTVLEINSLKPIQKMHVYLNIYLPK